MALETVDAAEESESDNEPPSPSPKRRCQRARIEEDPMIDYVELRGMIYKILDEREAQQPKAPATAGLTGYAIATIGALSLFNNICPDALKNDLASKFTSIAQPFLDRSESQSQARLKTGPTEACAEISSAPDAPTGDSLLLAPSTSV